MMQKNKKKVEVKVTLVIDDLIFHVCILSIVFFIFTFTSS